MKDTISEFSAHPYTNCPRLTFFSFSNLEDKSGHAIKKYRKSLFAIQKIHF